MPRQQLRQRCRIRGVQPERAIGHPAVLAQHAGRNHLHAGNRSFDTPQRQAAGLDHGIDGDALRDGAGQCCLADARRNSASKPVTSRESSRSLGKRDGSHGSSANCSSVRSAAIAGGSPRLKLMLPAIGASSTLPASC